MNEHPKILEIRHFTCDRCNYSAEVHGEMYFDYGCHHYMATFECKECQTLFEDLITKFDGFDANDEIIYDLRDVPICLKCGTQNTKIWNKSIGKCPKCGGDMKFSVESDIFLYPF